MSLADWFRRVFSPSAGAAEAEERAALREEYGEDPLGEPAPGGGPGITAGGGVPGQPALADTGPPGDAAEPDEPHDRAS
jgi:hypothetical protein